MRFKLILSPKSDTMPINYQYPFSAWIYKTISDADADFAKQLHDAGYTDGVRNFKFFAFSRLMVKRPKPASGSRLRFAKSDFPVEMSFYLDEIFRPFILGLFKGVDGQVVDKFGGTDFSIQEIQRLPEPTWKEVMEFETLSPVHVTLRQDARHAKFLSPFDAEYETALFDNLVHKYQAANPDSNVSFDRKDFRFALTSNLNKRQITIKEHQPDSTKLIAYDFACRISAPVELMKVAYDAGLGKSNSMGFGLLRVVER